MLNILEELSGLGVSMFVQQYGMESLDAEGRRNAVAQLIFTMLAEFARMERETMIERINSGLAEAQRKGVQLGRRKGSVKSAEQFLAENKKVADCLRKGYSVRNTAKICGCSTGTVQKVRRALA